MAGRLSAAERREQILRAATAVFARSTFSAARVSDIAAEAGVSEPLLYRHFAGKEALFCEVLTRVGDRITEIWRQETADAPDAREALRRAGAIYRANLESHPDAAALQFQALAEASNPAIASVLRANHARYVTFFRGLIERGKAEGSIRSDIDADAAAWLLNGIGFSFTLRTMLDHGEPTASDSGQISEMLLALISERGPTRLPPTPRGRKR